MRNKSSIRRHRTITLLQTLEPRRMLSGGLLDPAFSVDGKAYQDGTNSGPLRVYSGEAMAALRADGSLFIGSTISNTGSPYQNFTTVSATRSGSFGGTLTIGHTYQNGSVNVHDVATAYVESKTGARVMVGSTDAPDVVGGHNTQIRVGDLGLMHFDVDGTDDRGVAAAFRSDNSFVLAIRSGIGGNENITVARVTNNGQLDTSFNGVGYVTFDLGAIDVATSIAITSDDKILVAGYSNSGGTNKMVVLKVNQNATLDTSFGDNGIASVGFGPDTRAGSVAIDSQGRIVLVGSVDDGTADVAVARLLANGALDTSFNPTASPTPSSGNGRVSFGFDIGGGNVTTNSGVSIQIAPNDGILIGARTNANATTAGASAQFNYGVAQLFSNGSFNTTFDGDGKKTLDMGGDDRLSNLLLTPDNAIILSGLSNNAVSLASLRGATSNPQGFYFAPADNISQLAGFTYNSTKIYSGGASGRFFVAGKTPGANPNQVFMSLAVSSNPAATLFARDLIADDIGRLTIVGYSTVLAAPAVGGADIAVGRFIPGTNSADTGFNEDGVFTLDLGKDDRALAVLVQRDFKTLIIGTTSDANNSAWFAARLTSDGQLDPTFGVNGVQTFSFGNATFATVTGAALLADGRIAIAGYTTGNNGTPAVGGFDTAVALLNSDGSLNTNFSGDGLASFDLGDDDRAVSIVAQRNRLVIGASTKRNTTADVAVLGINFSGTPDAAFGTGGTFAMSLGGSDSASELLIGPDDKLYLAANTDAGQVGKGQFAVVRLTADGNYDTTFQPADSAIASEGRSNHFVYRQNANVISLGALMMPNGHLQMWGIKDNARTIAPFDFGTANAWNVKYGTETAPTVRFMLPMYATLGSLNSGLFSLVNTTTNQVIPSTELSVYQTLTGTGLAEIDFGYEMSIGLRRPLPDGHYVLTLQPGLITDSAGNRNTLQTYQFSVLTGDLNQDNVINFDDLLILSQNFGSYGRGYSQGNLNYSTDGLVDFDDLLLLAQKYGTSLVVPVAKRSATARSKSSDILA